MLVSTSKLRSHVTSLVVLRCLVLLTILLPMLCYACVLCCAIYCCCVVLVFVVVFWVVFLCWSAFGWLSLRLLCALLLLPLMLLLVLLVLLMCRTKHIRTTPLESQNTNNQPNIDASVHDTQQHTKNGTHHNSANIAAWSAIQSVKHV